MLQINIPDTEFYNSETREFFTVKGQTLRLEHSLVSLSKWESKWRKPFLTDEIKSNDETIDYIKCMTLTQNVDPVIYNCITPEILDQINEYIKAPMTATWFSEDKNKNSKANRKLNGEQITSELIYYWMIALQIPVKFEKWHLNRLITLIRVCNIKNQPPKKRSTLDIMRSNAELNAARRKKLNSKG